MIVKPCLAPESAQFPRGKEQQLPEHIVLNFTWDVPRQPCCLLPTIREEQ